MDAGLKCSLRLIFLILLGFCGQFKISDAVPAPQNPMEAIGMGAMTMLGTASEVLTNGGAVRQEKEIEMPFVKMRGKAEAGVGDAIRPRVPDSDEDNRRRKRSVGMWNADLFGELNILPAPEESTKGMKIHPHVHRNKRSPCHYMMGGGMPSNGGGENNVDPDGGEDDLRRRRNQRRRRALQRMQRMRKRRQQGKSSKSSTSGRRRRRRQAEMDEMDNEAQNFSNKLAEHAKKVAQKIQGIFDSMMQGMSKMMENLRRSFGEHKSPQAEDFV